MRKCQFEFFFLSIEIACVKRDLFGMCQKRPNYVAKEAYLSKETYLCGKRGLMRVAYLRYAEVSKETYYKAKRPTNRQTQVDTCAYLRFRVSGNRPVLPCK